MEMLPELIEEGRRVLLFSQFTSMLALIRPELERAGIALRRAARRHGRPRHARCARFQAGEVPLFLISLKAGGIGLNLTAADTVIHYDPWWNPAVEEQATDRAHRIGQDKPVFVYKLIAEGTIEERMLELQEKQAGAGRRRAGRGRRRPSPASARPISSSCCGPWMRKQAEAPRGRLKRCRLQVECLDTPLT